MRRILFLSWIMLSFAFVFSRCNKSSDEPKIVIKNVWSRPVTIPVDADTNQSTGYNGAVYLKIINDGSIPDKLLSAKTDVCAITETHQSFIKNDRMMMEPVVGGIGIPTNGSAELKPGGYHLMLMGMKRSLAEGDSFAVQLKFEKSGIRDVYAKVKKF